MQGICSPYESRKTLHYRREVGIDQEKEWSAKMFLLPSFEGFFILNTFCEQRRLMIKASTIKYL